MKIARNRAAKRLPGRHRFALSRLIAFMMPARRSQAVEHVMYSIDPDQSAVEVYVTSALYFIATVSYLADFFPLLLAVPIASVAIQIPMYISGAILLRGRNNLKVNSVLMMTLLFAASIYMAGRGSWLAWGVLGVFASNALAAVVMFALRGRVREVEERCGV